jgi:hypothetical protein
MLAETGIAYSLLMNVEAAAATGRPLPRFSDTL